MILDIIYYLVIGITISLISWVMVVNKPWWKMTPEEKKERQPYIILIAMLVLTGFFLIVFYLRRDTGL